MSFRLWGKEKKNLEACYLDQQSDTNTKRQTETRRLRLRLRLNVRELRNTLKGHFLIRNNILVTGCCQFFMEWFLRGCWKHPFKSQVHVDMMKSQNWCRFVSRMFEFLILLYPWVSLLDSGLVKMKASEVDTLSSVSVARSYTQISVVQLSLSVSLYTVLPQFAFPAWFHC